MADIEKNIVIDAPIEVVWSALTVPAAIDAWMDDDGVKVDLKVGGRYQLFGGDTTGTFTLIEAPNRLEYTWRQREWQKDWPDSVVHWELQATNHSTKVHLTHGQFPNDQERDSHDEGWDLYFLDPMKDELEST